MVSQNMGRIEEILAQSQALRQQRGQQFNNQLDIIKSLPAIQPQTNFLSDFGTELVDQASFNVLDRPSGGGVGSTLGRVGGGFANAATLTGLLGLTGVAPELGIPAAAALAGFLGSGSLEARTQYNKSGRITDPGAVLGQGGIDMALNLIPGSKAAGFLRRAAVDVPVQGAAGLVGDLASQGIRGQGFDLNEAVQSTAAGGGMGVFSALLGGPRPQANAPQVDIPPNVAQARQALQQSMARNALPNVKVDPRLYARPELEAVDAQLQALLGKGPTTAPELPAPIQSPGFPLEITPENATPMGFKLKADGFVDPASLNSPTAQIFNGKKSVMRAGEAFGLNRNEIVPVQVGKNEWAIHRIDAEAQVKPQPVPDFIGLGSRPKVDSNPIQISTVIRESLSADRGAQDALVAYDFLESMGFTPKPIGKDSTTGTGKQHSIKIGDKLAVIRGNESLPAFLERNEIGFDGLARSMSAKKANIERLLEQLPDSPAKNTFLENEMVVKQGREAVKEFEHLQNLNKKADSYLKQMDQATTEADLEAIDIAMSSDPEMVTLYDLSPELGIIALDRETASRERIRRIENGEYTPPKTLNDIPPTPSPLSPPAPSALPGIGKPPSLANVLRGLEPDQARTVYDMDLSQVEPGTKVEGLGTFKGLDEAGLPIISRKGGKGRPGESGVAFDSESLPNVLQKAQGVLAPEDAPMLQQIVDDMQTGQATEFVGRAKVGRSADLPDSMATPGTLNAFGSKANDRVMNIQFMPKTAKAGARVVANVVDSNGNFAQRIIREEGQPEVGFMRTGSKPELPVHASPVKTGKRDLASQELLQSAASVQKATIGTKHASNHSVQRIDAAVASNDVKGLEQAIRDFSRLPKEVQNQMGVQAGCIK